MMTDPIADMLTRIRNAARARHTTTLIPASTMKRHIAEILKAEGFIADHRDIPEKRAIEITLKYGQNRQSVIDGIRRVSKPGRRVYVSHDKIPRVLSGLGICILSTSRGVMSDKDARKHRIGGELLCEVW